MEAMNKEVLVVVDGLAEFIANNPVQFQEALDLATTGTAVVDWEPLEPGRVQYEFKQAAKLNSRAEDYAIVNLPNKVAWIPRLDAAFSEASQAAKTLACCWTNTYDGAAEIGRRHEAGEWALAQKLGMVTKAGSAQPITIKAYVTEVLPTLVSEQEWVEL